MVDWLLNPIIILILLILGGIVSAWKQSLIYVRKSELEAEQKAGNPRAAAALKLMESQDRVSLAVNILINLITIICATLAVAFSCTELTVLLAQSSLGIPQGYCQWSSLIILILILAFLRMLIIDAIPRKIAQFNPLKVALQGAAGLNFITFVISVPAAVLGLFSRMILKILRQKPSPPNDGVTEERIMDMLDEGAKTGEFDLTEQAMIKSVFDFADATVSHCMTPRTEVAAIDNKMNFDEIMKFIKEEGYSRYPVYGEDLDHIVGILVIRDILGLLYEQREFNLEQMTYAPYFVPDSKKISELLTDFQERQIHMAIVLDEFGGTAGIITIEDIIEELVGEIQDEFDTEEEEFRLNSDGSAEVSPHMDVDEFNEAFATELPEDLADTIGGLIFTRLGELPRRNQKIQIEGVVFTITSISGTRIEKVTARKTG